MKGRYFRTICIMAVVCALFFIPASVRADEKLRIETVDYGYAEIIQDVLSDDNPLLMLSCLDEESRRTLEEHMSVEEQKEFCAIYRYMLLTDAAKADESTEVTSDILDAELIYYKELVSGESMADIDLEAVEQQAFQTFRSEMTKKDAEWEIKTDGASQADSYFQYLQAGTAADIKDLADKLSAMDTEDETVQEELYEELRMQLYEIYGISYHDEKTASVESPQEAVGETVKEVDKEELNEDEKRLKSASISKAAAVARVDGNYYTTFNEAFDRLPDGGTLYVLRDCTAIRTVTEKSFCIYPEGQNVKITFQESSPDAAGIICTPDGWFGSPTWTVGGNGGYTLTLDANGKAASGVLSTYGATINLKSGVRLTNAAGNGVWNESGTTSVYDDVKIYDNDSHGIASCNTINMYGGEIYGNAYDGIRAGKVINLSGGSIYDNGECGIHPGDSSCTLTMTGGSSFRNTNGIGTYGGETSMYIQGGDIYENIQCGVMFPGRLLKFSGNASIRNNYGPGIKMSGGEAYVEGGSIRANEVQGNGGGICVTGGKLCLAGGTISGNTANQGKGIYFDGAEFEMRGFGAVDEGNDVYLAQNKYIKVTDVLQASVAAKLTFADYWVGRKAAKVTFGEQKGSMQHGKFTMTSNGSFCLRPGDYQNSAAKTEKADIVLSTGYQVRYDKNIVGEVSGMPGTAVKYWYEVLPLSAAVPSLGNIRFLGWSENAEGKTAQYQPNETLPAAQNKNTILYALWGPQLRVIYSGNGNDKGTEKSEIVTARSCAASGGYVIRKNAELTKFQKAGYKMAGWDVKKDTTSKNTRYKENQKYTVSFDELLSLAIDQHGGTFPVNTGVAELSLYAVWDEEPMLTAKGNQEFYEGTEVTGEMLLENVRAIDKEDGEITKSISIAGIEYGAGRWDGKSKQGAYTEEWIGQTPEAVRLDTWFEQLKEEDSPVEHTVIYQVTDSIGNMVTLKWPVKVKFNEYPKIEAPDRYFTLEEAQSGAITEAVLLQNALAEEKLKVTDTEEDQLFPGRMKENIKLIDFQPEEFKSFEESGSIAVTYTVQDSMGPEGNGKETFHQCMLYIVKDGEVKKVDPVTYVRFIDKKNYEKNLNRRVDETKSTNMEAVKNGGLLPASKWYQDPEYKMLLSGLWSDSQDAAGKWRLTAGDVNAVKSYVEEHGIGNSKEQTALYGFLEQFGHLQIL